MTIRTFQTITNEMEGTLRICEDKQFVLYKSHFLWTHEAYQPHKEPQWGSEIQANTSASPPLLPLFSPHALSLCMQLQHYVCSCVRYTGVLVTVLCLWSLHCTGTLIR